jgi:hypothetical protein
MFMQTALEAFEAWHEEKNGLLDEANSRVEQLEEQLQQLQEELAAEQEPRCGCGVGATLHAQPVWQHTAPPTRKLLSLLALP